MSDDQISFVAMKMCPECGNIGEFGRDKNKPDGLTCTCKKCSRLYQRGVYRARRGNRGYYYPMSLKERMVFWKYVDSTPLGACWAWKGGRSKKGYGQFKISGVTYLAHRVMYEYYNGVVACADVCILHMCDNPECVNPGHLRAGSRIENIRDMDNKGRRFIRRGEQVPSSKLTSSMVLGIRREREGGISAETLADKHGVCAATIREIVRRRTWKHV